MVGGGAGEGPASWSLDSLGPAVASSAFITGYDTATMRAVLQTDPAATGTYEVTFRLFAGNSVTAPA